MDGGLFDDYQTSEEFGEEDEEYAEELGNDNHEINLAGETDTSDVPDEKVEVSSEKKVIYKNLPNAWKKKGITKAVLFTKKGKCILT